MYSYEPNLGVQTSQKYPGRQSYDACSNAAQGALTGERYIESLIFALRLQPHRRAHPPAHQYAPIYRLDPLGKAHGTARTGW